MCGIVGYIGNKNVVDVLTSGLDTLKYRGYDSAGIAIFDENEIKIFKAEGKLENLTDKLSIKKDEIKNPKLGIGHIRWATHGKPTETNAHPHTSEFGDIVLVHNGIIENFKELKEELEKEGAKFKSQTDTEVAAYLIGKECLDKKDFFSGVKSALEKLEGAYALCIMNKNNPDEIIVSRKAAPLIIGIGEDENIIASDIPAVISVSKSIVYLEDGEIGIVKKDTVEIFDKNSNPVKIKTVNVAIENSVVSKMGHKHYMLKEIYEQPSVIRNLISGRIQGKENPINLDEITLDKNFLKTFSKIQIVACGTSYHVGIVAKYLIEDLTGITTEIEAASEYIYRSNTLDENTLVIAISQSGETADTLTAVKQAKEKNAKILVITNRTDSNITRYADSILNVMAGIEVSVASTKAYTAQLLTIYLFAIYLAEIRGKSLTELENLKDELFCLPVKIEEILAEDKSIEKISEGLSKYKDFIYIGRGINLATSMEGALKLKEISYINANAYPAGELKHGPIALLDENMPVLSVLIPNHISYDKMISNCEEAKARGAKMIAVTPVVDDNLKSLFDIIISIPPVSYEVSPLLTVVVLQLISYHISNFLGKDVDQPRNLAKSVTVE